MYKQLEWKVCLRSHFFCLHRLQPGKRWSFCLKTLYVGQSSQWFWDWSITITWLYYAAGCVVHWFCCKPLSSSEVDTDMWVGRWIIKYWLQRRFFFLFFSPLAHFLMNTEMNWLSLYHHRTFLVYIDCIKWAIFSISSTTSYICLMYIWCNNDP